jgi:hypothetical protein
MSLKLTKKILFFSFLVITAPHNPATYFGCGCIFLLCGTRYTAGLCKSPHKFVVQLFLKLLKKGVKTGWLFALYDYLFTTKNVKKQLVCVVYAQLY